MRRWISRNAPKGGMFRAAAALGGATAATQAVGIVFSPIFSRLYSPADFGQFGVYNSTVATALTIGSLCYETGIPVGEDDSEAVTLTVLATALVVLVGLGALFWLALAARLGIGLSGRELGNHVWLVPVGIIFGGAYQAVRCWALRRKAIQAIARTTISQLISSKSVSLAFGVLYPCPLGLILSGIASLSTGTWGLVRRTRLLRQLIEERTCGLSFRRIWTAANKYRRLPLICAPSVLFNSLGLYLPGILLVPYFGAEFGGQYVMAKTVIAMPAALVGGALSQVFMSSAAAIARERPQELAWHFDRFFIRGAAFSSSLLVVGLTAPWVVPFALGHQWRPAGEIAFWLSLYSTGGLVVSGLSSVVNIVGYLRGQFVIDVARASAVFLVLYLGHREGLSGMTVVKGLTAVMAASYVACYLLYRHLVSTVSRSGRTGWHRPRAL